MQHILSPEGETALLATVESMPLLGFDFDGTLSPIVTRPERARMVPGVSALLSTLSTWLPIAIITGRQVADVKPRLGFEPRYVMGSHGAENDLGIGGQEWLAALDKARHWLQIHGAQLDVLGVQVEDKRHSIALHYRSAPNNERVQQQLGHMLDTLDRSLHVVGGKFVFNIVAADAPNKADAMHSLIRVAGCSSAIFVGDDLNDEPVFESAGPGWLTIKVGPPKDHSSAHFYLNDPSEMTLLLDRLIRHLNATKASRA